MPVGITVDIEDSIGSDHPYLDCVQEVNDGPKSRSDACHAGVRQRTEKQRGRVRHYLQTSGVGRRRRRRVALGQRLESRQYEEALRTARAARARGQPKRNGRHVPRRADG